MRDSYVAEMKGVILSLAPDVRFVDVTHEVEPQQVADGALVLDGAAAFFPAGTIHLAVVDPGVGTPRRGIVVAAGSHLFVGPDNGLLTSALLQEDSKAFELTAPEYRLPVVSRTFHGRDVFAPAAAHLALRVPPASFGPPVSDPVRLAWVEAREVAGGVTGTVVHVDRFGNLVTSITARHIERMVGPGRVRIAGRLLPMVGTYGELPPGGAGALVGSRNRLEVVVRDGSAADRFRARRGTPVLLRWTTRPPETRRPRGRS